MFFFTNFLNFFSLFIFIPICTGSGMCMIITRGAIEQRKDEQHTNTQQNQSVHSYTYTYTNMFYDKFIAHFLFIFSVVVVAVVDTVFQNFDFLAVVTEFFSAVFIMTLRHINNHNFFFIPFLIVNFFSMCTKTTYLEFVMDGAR